MIERLYSFAGDGWWPRLDPAGETVCFGNHESRAWHIGGGEWPAVPGIRSRFIWPGVVTFMREIDREHAHRYERRLSTGLAIRSGDDPALVAGNDFEACGGNWASVLSGGRLCINGIVFPGSYGGLATDGAAFLVAKDQTRFAWFIGGGEHWTGTEHPRPFTANAFRLAPGGLVTFGYFGDSPMVKLASGETQDVTITPWRREGPPVLVQAGNIWWAWSFTEAPSGRLAVVGQPLRAWHNAPWSHEVIAIPDWDASSHLDVKWDARRQRFVLAGSSDRGALQVWAATLDHPRIDLRTWLGTQPPPPPPPPVDPPPTMEPVMIPDHSHIVQAVSDAHPHLIAQNTTATMTELLWRVAVALHYADDRWGLLSKSAGENHTVIAGQRVSVDAVAYGDSDEIVDIFRATGDGPGTGGLTWSVDERRPSNVRVTPPPFPGDVPVDPPDEPGPVDPPPTGDVQAALLAEILGLRALLQQVYRV
jgi:hypothetical protein